MTKKKYSKGEIETAKGLDELTSRTFQLRQSEIAQLDKLSFDNKLSRSNLVRRALKAHYGIEAKHQCCKVGFHPDDEKISM